MRFPINILSLNPSIVAYGSQKSYVLVIVCMFCAMGAIGQPTVVKGKVTDAGTGTPLAFVNVIFVHTNHGGMTDFDGNFEITTSEKTDSINVSYFGYKGRTKAIVRGQHQIINFQLVENVTMLEGIQIFAGENPAFAVMRNVIAHKKTNDKRSLSAYEYDSYTKIEIDVNNISKELMDTKLMKQISAVVDSIALLAGEDGEPIIPILISESVSQLYYRDNPVLKKEFIKKSKISGIGIEDGTLIAQMVGASFQEYNFYQNWLTILEKEFVSPISDGWRLYYDYDLTDSLYLGEDYCYRLDFTPKSEQDLAFYGVMWITKNEYALKQIDVNVGKQANLDFIEKIRIQQELEATDLEPWIPLKNRILIDINSFGEKSLGMLAKFYNTNKNFVTNKPHEPRFYEQAIEMAEDARLKEKESYWDTLRHEPLTETEKNVYQMIDTINSLPLIKTYAEVIKTLIQGYYAVGQYDIGPYIRFISWNNVEGVRLQFGMRTNYAFSPKWVLKGNIAYGIRDEQWKYQLGVKHILSRKRWTTILVNYRRDIFRLGIDENELMENPLFLASTRWGNLNRSYYANILTTSFSREWFKGFSSTLTFNSSNFQATFPFGYYSLDQEKSNTIEEKFHNSEVYVEARYAKDETLLISDNERISLGTRKWPVFSIRYTRGFKGLLNSDFDYDKLYFSVKKRMRTGPLGIARLKLKGEYVFDNLPYPLLSMHLGNQSSFYTSATYNLMRYGEFVSNRYISFQWQQYFEGFFFNRIPLLKKLKWRFLATGNVLKGSLSSSNIALIANTDPHGNETMIPGHFTTGKPYIELGYGIENIFKFIRVDFIHRLTHLDNPKTKKFGIFFSAQFKL